MLRGAPRRILHVLCGIAALTCLCAAIGTRASTTTTYGYDSWGRLTSVVYPNGQVTRYTYDAAGNRTQVVTAAIPVANPVSVEVAADSSNNNVPLNVSGSFTSVAVATQASHGAATASGTSIHYTPTTGYGGADSFTYTASSSGGTSAPATVQVAVAPVAQAASMTVAYQSSNNPAPLSVLGNYSGVAVSSSPAHGSATPSGTSITYSPAAAYSGADSFQYTASNSAATSAPATISVTVNPAPPVANPVSASVNANTSNNPIPLNVTGGAPTSVAVSTQAAHGTATASGTSITYTPTTNYSGSDSFAYTASNAGGTSSPATAQLTVVGVQVTISTTLNCPAGATPTYVCGSGNSATHTFGTVYSAVTNGSGSYTYGWSGSGDSEGTWTTGQTTATITPAVSHVLSGNTSFATYTCTVTDTVTGKQATSNGIMFGWTNGNQ